LNAIKKGMVEVNNSEDGTASKVFNKFPIVVAGKTGTPETGYEKLRQESSNGVYVCYAPADKPQIAIVVVIEHGVWGANAAPVAKDILTEYFHMNDISKPDDSVKPDIPLLTR
jgi:penicillin-binding protein 2